MPKSETIDGLWRAKSVRSQGGSVDYCSHIHIERGYLRYIDPSEIDFGQRWKMALKRGKKFNEIELTLDEAPYKQQKKHLPLVRYERGIYERRGETLRICLGNCGEMPSRFTSSDAFLFSLVSQSGPVPAGKQSSGLKPIKDAVLGRLRYDDQYEWWESKVSIGSARCSIVIDAPPSAKLDPVLDRAREIVQQTKKRESEIRTDVAKNVHPDAEEWYLESLFEQGKEAEDSELPLAKVTAALRLSSVHIHEQGFDLGYNAGKLFRGHEVVAQLTDKVRLEEVGLHG